MYIKNRLIYIFSIILNLILLNASLYATESNPETTLETSKKDYTEALASLTFYLQEWEKHLTLEEMAETIEQIHFSDEEVNFLWNKVALHLFSPNKKSIPRDYFFEQAWQHYYQAKSLAFNRQLLEAQQEAHLASYFLTILWEEAIESEGFALEYSSLSSSVVLRKQKDSNFDHNPYLSKRAKKKIRPYLMPLHHPKRLTLDKIFHQRRVTADKETFHEAGFKTIASRPRSFIRVASHPLLRGYLLKVYLDTVLSKKRHKESWEWLVKRCEGAYKIRRILHAYHLKHFVVADKWIYCLPPEPSPPIDANHTRHLALLCVTDMKLAPKRLNYYAWYHYITPEYLDELYIIISRAKGSSYRPDNIAYTKKKTFAFIDTEYPTQGPDYKSIRHYLNPEMRTYWDGLVKHSNKPL